MRRTCTISAHTVGARSYRSAARSKRHNPTASSRSPAYVFFSYIGFDAATTTAEECKNPQRDVPLGVIGALAIGTLIYCATAVVLLGAVPWSKVPEKDPLLFALAPLHQPILAWIITLGVLAGSHERRAEFDARPIAHLLRDGLRPDAAPHLCRAPSASQNAGGRNDAYRPRDRRTRIDRAP